MVVVRLALFYPRLPSSAKSGRLNNPATPECVPFGCIHTVQGVKLWTMVCRVSRERPFNMTGFRAGRKKKFSTPRHGSEFI